MSGVTLVIRTLSGGQVYGDFGGDLPALPDLAAASEEMVALIEQTSWVSIIDRHGHATWVRCDSIETFAFVRKPEAKL